MTQGLKFKKIDLHFHSPGSSDFSDPNLKGLSDEEKADKIVAAIVNAGIEVIAIAIPYLF